MPEHERVIAVVREWVMKAENDLKNAGHTLKMGEECPTDTICFHAQQCVEKYLKAFLVGKDINIEVQFSTTVEMNISRNLESELRELIQDLGLTDKIIIS